MEENKEIVYKTKTKKGVIVLLIILIILLLGLSAYVVYDKKIRDNKNEETKLEEKKSDEQTSEKEKMPEKNNKYTFIESYSQKIIINNNVHTLLIYYYSENGKQVESWGEKLDSVHLYKEVYIDNKKIVDASAFEITSADKINSYITYDKENKTNSNMNTNLSILNDTANSNQYLMYRYQDYSKSFDLDNLTGGYGYNDNLVIVDENANIIDSLTYNADSGFTLFFQVNSLKNLRNDNENYDYWHDVSSEIYQLYGGETGPYEIHNNYIYYIDTTTIDYSKLIKCIANSYTEYKLEITDGKINKTKGYTFSGDEIRGAGGC